MTDNKCPNCGRILVGSADGRIGRCKVHGWFPMVEGAETDAAKRNADEISANEHKLLQAEADRQRAVDQENEQHHRKVISVICTIAVVVIAVLSLMFFYLIKPGSEYSRATKDFEAGRYESALDTYTQLDGYKDSGTRVSLCRIMLLLQDNNVDEATNAVRELVLDGSPDALPAFANAVSPILTGWEKKNIPPDLVMAIISKLDDTPLRNSLDSSVLWMDAHAALLSDTGIYWWQTDVNGDNNPDLIVIHADGLVNAYSMTDSGNQSISVNNDMIASAAVTEAQNIQQNDPARAVSLMAAACRLVPDNTDQAALREYSADLINRWKSMGIRPEEVLQALGLSVRLGSISTDDSFVSAWHEAALAVSGESRQHTFADWDSDGLDELLLLRNDNRLQLHGFQGPWKMLSELEELPENASYTITDDAPVIILVSGARDSIMSVTCAGNRIHKLFLQDNIFNYTISGSTITYSIMLPGSITRSCSWEYQAVSSSERPVRTGIEWQRNNYPMPSGANETMRRFTEAKAYDIPEEAALLTAQTGAEGFSLQDLDTVVFPDSVSAVSVMPYSLSDNEVLYEVTTDIDGRAETMWYAVTYNGQWKVAGVSDTFSPAVRLNGGDTGIRLICTNTETSDQLAEKNGRKTYRILLPRASRASLQWQAGTENGSSTAFTFGLYRDSMTSNPLVTYDLKQNRSKQQTRSFFLAPGVYYITVDAKQNSGPEYHMTVLAEPMDHIELEGNDTSKNATPIVQNQSYSGSLLTSGDIDFYSFRLAEKAGVNITLKSSGNGGKKTVFLGTVYNGSTGEKMTSFELPGNMPITESGNLYLDSGVYLIQINKGASWTDEEYSLTVTMQTEGVMEAESNNTPATANAVPVNKDIHGSIGTKGDVDCYQFRLDSDSAVQLRYSFASTGSSSRTYVLTVMDSNQRVLQSVTIGGKETSRVIAPVALKAGIYTVKVENPQYVKQEYTLRIVCRDVALSESEPNNAAAAATAISIGSPVTGALSAESDEDYYSITFAEQKTITFSFSFTPGTGSRNAFSISIERNGKTEWKQTVTAASGGIEQAMTVPAGEYYIRIKPGSAWNGNLYTISVE